MTKYRGKEEEKEGLWNGWMYCMYIVVRGECEFSSGQIAALGNVIAEAVERRPSRKMRRKCEKRGGKNGE